jgi:adenine-specific DNA-methyltransferase
MALLRNTIVCTDRYDPKADAVLSHADCAELMRSIPERSVQLIVTSPPYNIGKAYERRKSLDQYRAEQADVIAHCVRLLKDSGSICWQVGNHVTKFGEIVPLDILLYPIFAAHGLKLRNRIIWHFEHGLHCSRRFSGRYETILWFTKNDEYVFNLDAVRVPQKYPGKKYFKGPKAGLYSCNPLGKNPGDLWVIPNVKHNHVEKTVHPCQFPVELVERLVLALTNEGDWVFDPFMGVGTTPVAAVKHGRRALGADIVKEYVEIARGRVLRAVDGTLRTRPMNQPVYSPPRNLAITRRDDLATESLVMEQSMKYRTRKEEKHARRL